MSGVRAHIASRLRSSSLSAVPPRPESSDYSTDLARAAASILYRSPIPSRDNRPIFILNAAALPDSREADFDELLPYVIARLPEEDDLLKGYEYEVVFFAGDSDGSANTNKKRPGWGWFLQAYHVLSRAMRKRLQKLYIVHEKAWVRILAEVFSTIVSPKFRRKIIHASTLSNLALHLAIEDLLIPPSTYLYDRRVSEDIYAPYSSGRRAFAARQPFPISTQGTPRFPRVLRETTSFVLLPENVTAEGIFRVPPHAKLRDVLKEAYDRGQKYIIYKDNGAMLPVPDYPRAEHQREIMAELDPRDCYPVFMAAALIKAWYADLRQPIFPTSSYGELKRLHGDVDDLPDVQRLKDLLSPASEWSFLPAISREILVRHLLPLLSAVSAREEENKMTAENLAVCFAPALLCGPDQLEDAKMSSIVRRLLTAATECWCEGLREACEQTTAAFEAELRMPENENDWDDPLEGNRHDTKRFEDENQLTGIILQDNEPATLPATESNQPPPLPPRSSKPEQPSVSGRSRGNSVVNRKPAPPLAVPPRYSAIISDSARDTTVSPATQAATTDGFGPQRTPQQTSPTTETREKHSGTQTGGVSSSQTLPIVLPKRKALTAHQIDNAGSGTQNHARQASGELQSQRVALPGLANLNIYTGAGSIKRKVVGSSSTSSAETSPSVAAFSATSEASFGQSASPSDVRLPVAEEFRRPSWPASATRTPNITSLARPVQPMVNPTTGRPASKSTSLPVPGPKPRTPSPGLLSRMPSFETSKRSATLDVPPVARKLNLRKASVDDLRRLYEERAGTAKTLVEAGKKK